MQLNNCEINILINGRKASEYQSPMDFQNYIEGRDGSDFEIEIVNNNGVDVEAILSIDGLSVTDGKAAGIQSSGYLVRANSRFTVPGWMVDGEKAARFRFSGSKGGSYVEQSGGDATNKGVVGAKIFARKNRPVFVPSNNTTMMRGFGVSKGITSDPYSSGISFADSSYTMNCGSAAGGLTVNSELNASLTASAASLDFSPVEQTLGTEFGAATDFKTTEVDFERGDILAMMVLYYDDSKGLKQRGIDVKASRNRPSPFPADEPKGCTPPAGWAK